MKLNITKETLQLLIRAGLFLLLALVILYLYPNKKGFNFQFEVGKPWEHESLIATFDLPIYKSKKQLDEERGRLLQDFTPYYLMDSLVAKTQIEMLAAEMEESSSNVKNYVKRKFTTIYETGIIASDEYDKLLKSSRKEINCIMPDRLTRTISINKLYTPKTAYKEIVDDTFWFKNELKSYDLNNYLVENLKYDSIASKSAESELLKNLSLTSGMVPAGEKIIDQGEIVTQETYQKLNSLKIEYENRKITKKQSTAALIGEIIMILGLISLLFLYLRLFRPRIFNSYRNLSLVMLMMLFVIGLTFVIRHYTSFSYYIVPFALLPIVVRVFFDSRTALFAHIITTLIISFITDNPFQFVVLQIAAGMTAVSNLKDLTQRSQLAQTAMYIFLCYICLYVGFELIVEGGIESIRLPFFMYFVVSCSFLLLAYILIFFIEKIFGLISSVTLVELTNINSDFMMEFAEAAPGTFQHTLQVSNLATEAAKKINANSLLVRTGALYHDIGKIQNPHYFTENQMGGKNPLLEMDYEEAARIIINHVPDGVKLGKKNNLPEQILNFITTHHGTGKTKYFYNSFINANPGVEPNVAAFSYPGPRPNTKETAILMMADAVEARSRSLKEYTAESIDFMVEDMIDSQIADGQFKDAPISFQDVEVVKSVFKEKIKNIYHTRITYPKIENTI
jgi:uncharacterized domain HDIG